MTSACSDTIRQPCQSEHAEPEAFSVKCGGDEHRRLRLWRDQLKSQKSSSVYGCFAEGLDTFDPKEAKALS